MIIKLIRSPVIILLVFTFFKGVFWSSLTPIFQSPDEQNHFAYLQFISENDRRSIPWSEKNMSEEIIQTLSFADFNPASNHPFYIFEPSEEVHVKNENTLINLPISSRQNYLQIAAGSANPPAYYWLGSFFYKAVESHNIIDRVFAVRVLSVILGVGTIYLSYCIVRLFVPKNLILQLSIPILISLHPSFSFITSTITVDALTVFWTSLIIYFWILVIKKDLNVKLTLLTLAISFASIFIRETLSITLVVTVFLIIWRLKVMAYVKWGSIIAFLLSAFFLIRSDFFTLLLLNTPNDNVFRQFSNYVKQSDFLTSQFVNGTIFSNLSSYFLSFVRDFNNNIFSWYWGMFGWLEIQLPINIYRILKVLTFMSIAGVVYSIKNRKNLSIPFSKNDVLIFMSLAMVIVSPVLLFDFQKFVSESAHPFGFQGRYLLPGIVLHVILFFHGLLVWFPKKALKKVCLALIALFFVFHLISLWVIVSYFYHPSSIFEFIERVGWYKPDIYKGSWVIVWFMSFVTFFGIFLYRLGKIRAYEGK